MNTQDQMRLKAEQTVCPYIEKRQAQGRCPSLAFSQIHPASNDDMKSDRLRALRREGAISGIEKRGV